MSSVEEYSPEGLSVVIESDSSFSKSLGILIRLDRNVALFNPYLDSIHNKSIYNARDLTRYSHRKGLVLRASISYLIPVTPELPAGEANSMVEIFDHWPEKYDQWFEKPMGRLIKGYERDLILRMVTPSRGEIILDAGCGT